MLKWYIERPASLQNVTLADWAAWYDSCHKHSDRNTKKIDVHVDQLPLETAEDENNDDDLCDDCKKLKSKIKKRPKARIIRSPWFNMELNPEKHY